MRNVVLTALLLAAVAIAAHAGPPSQEPSLQTIMQRKLDHAHALLEALIVEDFSTLEDSASALLGLSDQAAWFVLNTSEYTQRSTAFRMAVTEIETSAKEQNLEGAALGYVEMTLKCVQCHQFLRGAARADALFEIPAAHRASNRLRGEASAGEPPEPGESAESGEPGEPREPREIEALVRAHPWLRSKP